MSRSPSRSPAPKILIDNPDSETHPSSLLLSTSQEDPSQAQNDDDTSNDRTALLPPSLPSDQDPPAKFRKSQWRDFSHRKRNIIVGLLTVILLVLVATAVLAWRLIDVQSPSKGANRQILVHAKHGAVATELDTCSNIGVNILQEGGNAVDAAIASGICIGSINMFSAGIGGSRFPPLPITHRRETNSSGGFMIVRHPNSTAKVFNFRETAPAGATKGMYDGDPLASLFGGLAVGVPGEIAGYAEASRMFGNLPWQRLFKESIEMMRDGFPVPPELANRIQKFGDFMLKDRDWEFLYPDGKLLVENDMLYRRNFSETLRKISEEGPKVFYNGTIAKALVKYIRSRGGIMTENDFSNYTVSVEEPIHGWYHGREIITCGAPCSGPALIQALNILEGFSLGKKGYMTPEEVHLLVESMKCIVSLETSN